MPDVNPSNITSKDPFAMLVVFARILTTVTLDGPIKLHTPYIVEQVTLVAL